MNEPVANQTVVPRTSHAMRSAAAGEKITSERHSADFETALFEAAKDNASTHRDGPLSSAQPEHGNGKDTPVHHPSDQQATVLGLQQQGSGGVAITGFADAAAPIRALTGSDAGDGNATRGHVLEPVRRALRDVQASDEKARDGSSPPGISAIEPNHAHNFLPDTQSAAAAVQDATPDQPWDRAIEQLAARARQASDIAVGNLDSQAKVSPVPATVTRRETHFAPTRWQLDDSNEPMGDGRLSASAPSGAATALPRGHKPTSSALDVATRTQMNAADHRMNPVNAAPAQQPDIAAGPVAAQIAGAVGPAVDGLMGKSEGAEAVAPAGFRESASPILSGAPVRILQLALSPAELGPVTITLIGHAAALRVEIKAERPETALQVEHEREALTRRLAEAGYMLDDLTVARGSTVSTNAAASSGDRMQGPQSETPRNPHNAAEGGSGYSGESGGDRNSQAEQDAGGRKTLGLATAIDRGIPKASAESEQSHALRTGAYVIHRSI